MYCPKCGKDVGTSKFCPECGADMSENINNVQVKKKKKKRGWIVFLILVLICVAIVSVIPKGEDAVPNTSSNTVDEPSSNTSQGESDIQNEEPVQDLELLDYSSTNDDYFRYATGHIRNNTDKTYSYVQVEINLYSGDTLVGSTLDNITNLAPGDEWEFSALITEDSADSFKIVDITGW